MILHIPHSSKYIPDEIRRTIVLSDKELIEELLNITDAFTDELFAQDFDLCQALVYPVSRLVVDPERFADDEKEPAAQVGLGVIYTNTLAGNRLRNPVPQTEREKLLNIYYYPHHEKLNRMVENKLEAEGKCLIVDCHSFPSKPWPCEPDQNPDRPAVCIGVDDFHTPPEIADRLVNLFKQYGYTVKINNPYAGSLVPGDYYLKEKNVFSVMVELNRKLYMKEETGERSNHFRKLQKQLAEILTHLSRSY